VSSVLWVLDCKCRRIVDREASEVLTFCAANEHHTDRRGDDRVPHRWEDADVPSFLERLWLMYGVCTCAYRENTCKENDGSHFTCVNKKTREHCAHKMRGSPRKVGGESIFKRPSPRFSCGSN
jgi:hypothetical protein